LKPLKPRILYYQLPGDWTLLVGASDADNDYLSTVLAEDDDWWFHADSVPGSHVLLRAKPDVEPTRETLRQAAAVALYHSKARNAGTAPVHFTRARHVKKPPGVKTGTVNVSKGGVLKVRPDVSFAVRVSGDKSSQHDKREI
jgi:predicted ribosome quality control (RQC) complex YloA/Tae2 family protein